MSIDSRSDERLWALIAWATTIVGAIVALVVRPQYKYTVYWAYLSISFFILAVIVGISTNIISLILSIIPFVGGIISEVVSALCSLLIFIVWVLGVVKSYKGEYWRIPVVYEVAEKLFKIEHETYMNC